MPDSSYSDGARALPRLAGAPEEPDSTRASATRDRALARRAVLARQVDALLLTACICVLVGLAFAGIDVTWRALGARSPDLGHCVAALALYSAAAALAGCFAHVLIGLEDALHRRVAERRPRLALALRTLLAGLAAAGLSSGTAFWVFGGARVRTTEMARHGPWALMLGVGVGAALLALSLSVALRRFKSGRRAGPTLFALLLAVAAVLVTQVDLRVYVALYARLHTMLEVVAAVLLLAAFSIVALWLPRWGVRAAAVAAFGCLLVLVAASGARAWMERELRGVWVEPIYAGRLLSRAQSLESYLTDPAGWRGSSASGIARLKEDYDIESTTLDPIWNAAPPETPAERAALAAMRRSIPQPNVAIFYVDTLRYDVASDPKVMPNVSEFLRSSVSFTRAYATGSDTLRSLPAITSGSLLARPEGQNDFLEVARRRGWHRGLVIPQSAHEFLDKEAPAFGFDERLGVKDFAPVRMDVWGYGADQPASDRVVDRSLEWMKQNKDKKFLLWSFHFDLHNWRELSDRRVAEMARTYDMPEGAGMLRYAVVARGIDAEFGRFLRGLDQLGLADDTIVVFLSDHGEGVGREGFWVHSIFLWDVLLRVPLALRVPGLAPRVVDTPVSLVDLAPTLARWFEPEVSMRGYHGEDLLARLLPGAPKRRRPLLAHSGTHDSARRLGVIDPAGTSKLVVQLESGVPELYDLSASDPDWEDLADAQRTRTLELLNHLVRSPVFPRADEATSALQH
ncbi:MAG: sulfatase-like hydrolase/transferase [Polyangiaceae bacterium]|nr:sulfatase-like hydrolase/transferase [Polyangiaceae bacterium]MCE7888622.1 hypothetical protein [Sorangiineae bacterium PRO1]MCL4749769.1 sulfatase-like hydrolase/transferase [Myxococcales bacterium]